MAEPARNLPPSQELEADDDGRPLLLRWIEHPDGRLEQLEIPLTPELFLEPQLEDKILQKEPHGRFRGELFDLLRLHFEPGSLILEDVRHDFGVPGLPRIAPDLSVILGARPGERTSFVVREEGVRPDLVIEVLSPDSARIRRVDEEDKPWMYERAGIPEYLIVDLPRRGNLQRFVLKGYRLNREGRYRMIKPDAQGRLVCEAAGLGFTVSPQGDRVLVFDLRTGERILYSEEEKARRMAAEARAAAAEEQAARLLEELDRLKRRLGS